MLHFELVSQPVHHRRVASAIAAIIMAYNQVAQQEIDALSDYDEAESRDSPDETNAAFPSLLPDSEISQEKSEPDEPPITRSREGSIPMRYPTPGQESLQGAYSNVERLEESADRLSLSSDIGEEIRKMRMEQQKSESRTSSLQLSQSEEVLSGSIPSRQLSYGQRSHASNSIIETNGVARSGGFSPAAYFASPRSSVKSGSWSNHNSVKGRSASQGPRLAQVKEPVQEGRPLDSPLSTRFAPAVPPLPSPTRALQTTNSDGYIISNPDVPRMQSPEGENNENVALVSDEDPPRKSQDTYRQEKSLFLDFDGTHAEEVTAESPQTLETPPIRRPPSQLLDVEPESQRNMVYYPAPVPMMLNLPQRLSKLPPAPKRVQRHTQLLDSLPQDARRSAAWLPEMPEAAVDDHMSAGDDGHIPSQAQKHRSTANMPAQLRATMFFDYPSTRQDVAVKGESAVATLDSILDASAFAPVSAFTDHPIVGHVGAEIYGRSATRPRASMMPSELADKRKRSSFNNLLRRGSAADLLNGAEKRKSSLMSLGNLGKRKSSGQRFEDAHEYQGNEAANIPDEGAPLQQSQDADDQSFEDAQEHPEGTFPMEETAEQEYTGAPTTLLAELQLRKQQQKKRTRTAATAFPEGIHSTLLQLDAVAQVEKQARYKKHTTLAWEDPDAHVLGLEDEDDEDVPLGMLYPPQQMDQREKARRLDEQRPLGLIARREIEDSEPLSHRRARLRGEPSIRNQSLMKRDTMYSLDLPDMQGPDPQNADSDNDDPEETLAQRKARMKATQIPVQQRRISTDFASEILTQFEGLEPSPRPEESRDPIKRTTTKTPDLNGVEETLGQRRKRLQAEVAARNGAVEGGTAQDAGAALPAASRRRSMADILQAHPAAGAGSRSAANEVKYAPPPKMRNTPWAANVNHQAGLGGVIPGAGPIYGYGNVYHGMATGQNAAVPVDPRQRDMIDRWRQTVMH